MSLFPPVTRAIVTGGDSWEASIATNPVDGLETSQFDERYSSRQERNCGFLSHFFSICGSPSTVSSRVSREVEGEKDNLLVFPLHMNNRLSASAS